MRNHNKALCSLVAETIDCPGPVFEFGSYQVDGQEGFADLRSLFPGREYVGCDMRPGPGVDRVEDVTAINLPDSSAGTVLCIETFEHVFEVRRAFDEVFRILKPGGVFVITSPLNFRIHGYPDDYWRMTPNCLRRHARALRGSIIGLSGLPRVSTHGHGHRHEGPGSLASNGAPRNNRHRLQGVARAGRGRAALGEKVRRRVSQIYRSKGERRQIAGYYSAEFAIDTAAAAQGGRQPRSEVATMAAG